jgi:2-polyprenyl-6-methoxyphenol hydroxylase-like FAD-dependent oxidoreductase
MNVLICGASLAGPTLAYWLTRAGFDVTVVERATTPRRGGAPIDVRGAAIDVAKRMGILAKIRDARTHTRGIEFVHADGKRMAVADTDAFAKAVGEDVELERGALVDILFAATENDVEYRFDTAVDTLDQDGGGVDVTLTNGEQRRFDLVVGADGLHSTVRRLAFGEEARFVHHLGMYVATFGVDPALGRTDWGVLHNSPGKVAGVYSHHGAATAFFMFRSPPLAYDHRDADQQRKLLTSEFAGQGWRVPRLLDALPDADDFYFDSVSQVRMETWSAGRATLIGDAGYCPALLSGMGTTLAMVGADTLARALATTHLGPALAAYERAHRPLVQGSQRGVTLSAALLAPATRAAMWRRDQLLRLLPLVLTARRFLGR